MFGVSSSRTQVWHFGYADYNRDTQNPKFRFGVKNSNIIFSETNCSTQDFRFNIMHGSNLTPLLFTSWEKIWNTKQVSRVAFLAIKPTDCQLNLIWSHGAKSNNTQTAISSNKRLKATSVWLVDEAEKFNCSEQVKTILQRLGTWHILG